MIIDNHFLFHTNLTKTGKIKKAARSIENGTAFMILFIYTSLTVS